MTELRRQRHPRDANAPQIRAVLFDKDGTLIDFHASWIGAGQTVARKLCALAAQPQRFDTLVAAAGYDPVGERLDPHSRWAAGTTESLVRHWMAELGLDTTHGDELAQQMTQLMSAEAARQVVPLADLASLFAMLRSRGLRLGVATMDLESHARKTLRRLGADECIDFVCGCDSGHGIKPQPGMVFAFCEHLGLSPDEVMMVGDTPHDMNMARAAGVGMAVAVTSGTGQAGDLAALADCVVDNLHALPALLSTIQAD